MKNFDIDKYFSDIKVNDTWYKNYNEDVLKIDPYSTILTKHKQELIYKECLINPLYFFTNLSSKNL